MNPAVKRLLLTSRLRSFAGVAYRTIINLELATLQMLDSLSSPEILPEGGGLEQLTALIKTFERPRTLARLVASIQRRYPGMNTLVVDDSRQPKLIPGIEWLTLPFDSGVSAGRSAGLRQVGTPFTLLLDDDFVFYLRTGLRAALAFMVQYPEIDIMGGTVLKLPLFHKADYSTIKLYPTTAKPVRPLGSYIGPFPVFDKAPNFYIARTERLLLVNWDPKIKRLDHADFFTRARGVLTTVHNRNLRCLHVQTPFDTHYMDYRNDLKADINLLRKRYYTSN